MPFVLPGKVFRGKKAYVQAPKGWPAFLLPKTAALIFWIRKKCAVGTRNQKGAYISLSFLDIIPVDLESSIVTDNESGKYILSVTSSNIANLDIFLLGLDVILEVFAETEEGTYDLGIATMVKLYKYTTNKRQIFSNIVNDLIDSYNLYMYVRLLDDYHNNYDSKGNKIYEDFLNNKETSNFSDVYNKAVDFITKYNDIDVCDIPEFLKDIKGSRMLNEYTDIDTLVGEDFYLT